MCGYSHPAVFRECKYRLLDDSEVLTHHGGRLSLIAVAVCPVFFQGVMSPKQGDRKVHESAPKPPEPTAEHVMGNCP